jgi:putative acetyltransferase
MPELKKALSIYEQFGFRFLNGPLGNTGHCGCSMWMLLDLFP